MSVQKLRLDRGWSQEHLAQTSGLSLRTIQRIKSGRTAGLESLNCLAAVFEVDISQIQETRKMPNNDNTKAVEGEVFEDPDEGYNDMMIAFKINLFAFLILIPALSILNLMVSPDVLWVKIIALLWGAVTILLAFIVKAIFGKFKFYGIKF